MLRAHRQAWCWQDEYYGLTIDDIRRLERETQLALQEKMTSSDPSSAQPTADGTHIHQHLSDVVRICTDHFICLATSLINFGLESFSAYLPLTFNSVHFPFKTIDIYGGDNDAVLFFLLINLFATTTDSETSDLV